MRTLKIQNAKPIQENFLGNNAVYHGYAGLPDTAGRVYSEEFCELEADRAKALGLKIARTYYKWYSYDFKNRCWDWKSEEFEAFCRWVERLKVRDIDIAVNTGWCMPGDILSNGWGGVSPFTVEGDWAQSVQNYACWVSETVHQLVEVRGLTNVKYLQMFTEPQYATKEILPKEADTAYEAWYQATRAVADRLIQDGRRQLVQLVGPNEGSTADPKMMDWVYRRDPDLLDVYTCHNYLNGKLDCTPLHGNWGVSGCTRGMRIYQSVTLRPHTEYELKIALCVDSPDLLTINGYITMGVFNLNLTNGKPFTSGNQPTTRLMLRSTHMIDAGELSDAWQYFTFRFTTGETVDGAAVGVFSDIAQADAVVYIGEAGLVETKTGCQLLKNSKFTDASGWEFVGCALYSVSSYDTWTTWVNTATSYLKPGIRFWFDEYNTGGRGQFAEYHEPYHGTDLAVARVAFMNSGIESSEMWTLFDQQWPNNHTQDLGKRYNDGDHRFGVMPVLTRTTVPYPAYYAVQLTGYVGNAAGTKVYRGIGADDVNLTMTVQPDGTITILTVNDTAKAADIRIAFEQPLNADLHRYMYDPATILPDANATPIASDGIFLAVKDELCDTLPSGAVAVYTSKLR